MSDRRRLDQLDLFQNTPTKPEPRASIDGLTVELVGRHCRHCGGILGVVAKGEGPHVAAVKCAECGAFRQWLPHKSYEFLVALVDRFGVPGEPIEIRKPIGLIHIGKIDVPPTKEE